MYLIFNFLGLDHNDYNFNNYGVKRQDTTKGKHLHRNKGAEIIASEY